MNKQACKVPEAASGFIGGGSLPSGAVYKST